VPEIGVPVVAISRDDYRPASIDARRVRSDDGDVDAPSTTSSPTQPATSDLVVEAPSLEGMLDETAGCEMRAARKRPGEILFNAEGGRVCGRPVAWLLRGHCATGHVKRIRVCRRCRRKMILEPGRWMCADHDAPLRVEWLPV
jgi:hypothetical protein